MSTAPKMPNPDSETVRYHTDSDDEIINSSSTDGTVGTRSQDTSHRNCLPMLRPFGKRSIPRPRTREINVCLSTDHFETPSIRRIDDPIRIKGLDEIKHVCEPGFVNLDNNGYANAALQCLLHCEPFVTRIQRSANHSRDTPRHSSSCVFDHFSKLVQLYFQKNGRKAISPSKLLQKLFKTCKLLIPGEQHDPLEFIQMLFRSMDKVECSVCDGRRKGQEQSSTYIGCDLRSPFGGALTTQTECINCKFTSAIEVPFSHLSLRASGVTSMLESLNAFVSEGSGRSEKAYCQNCEELSTTLCRSSISKHPEVLVIQLNRLDGETAFDEFIEYPLVLNIRPFMSCGGVPVEYELVAVLSHDNCSRNRGQYVAHVRVSDGHWCRSHDKSRAKLPFNLATKINAYLLFYQERTPLPGCNDVPDGGIPSVEGSPSTPIMRENKQGAEAFHDSGNETCARACVSRCSVC